MGFYSFQLLTLRNICKRMSQLNALTITAWVNKLSKRLFTKLHSLQLNISSVLTTDRPLLLTTDYSNTHLQLPSTIWSRPRQQLRFFWIFWILRIFHNEYMHEPWSPAILGTGNSFETWWWYWHSGLIMNIGLSDDIMRFEKVILTLHLKVFYIKSVYKHMELCEYENYNWPNIRDKRLSNGKLLSIFS